MISSGRSFTSSPLSSRVVRWSSVRGAGARGGRGRWRRRAASPPGGRGRRSGRGRRERVASTLRPDACSIWPTIACASSADSSTAVVSSTLRLPLLAAPRAARTRAAISAISAARPFSATSSRKLRTSSSAPLEHVARARAAFARGSSCGLRRSAVELGHVVERLRRSRRARRGPLPSRPLLGGLEQRLRRRCGATTRHLVWPSPSSTEKSRSRDRLVDQPALVGAVEHLAGHLRRRRCSVSSATSARICSSARRVSASIWRLVSSSRRWRSASVSSRTRSRCASATSRASARISSASPRAWPIRARCSSSSLRASSRAWSASSIASTDPLAALVDRLLDRAEGVPLRARRT